MGLGLGLGLGSLTLEHRVQVVLLEGLRLDEVEEAVGVLACGEGLGLGLGLGIGLE